MIKASEAAQITANSKKAEEARKYIETIIAPKIESAASEGKNTAKVYFYKKIGKKEASYAIPLELIDVIRKILLDEYYYLTTVEYDEPFKDERKWIYINW